MSLLTKYLNLFTLDKYPPGENGRSEVPIADIHAAMRHLFPNGYHWKVVSAGFSPNGRPFFVGNLTVMDEEGLNFTVPGSADLDPSFGLAGAATVAFKNAVLRGLGMGEELYQNTPEPSTVAPPQSHYTTSESKSTTYNGRNGENSENNRGYSQGYRRNGPPPPWNGEVPVKNGEFAGTKYKDMPAEVLEKWANNGVVTAQKELDRRASPAAQQAVSNSPFPPTGWRR